MLPEGLQKTIAYFDALLTDAGKEALVPAGH
jgi:hypothetical protein